MKQIIFAIVAMTLISPNVHAAGGSNGGGGGMLASAIVMTKSVYANLIADMTGDEKPINDDPQVKKFFDDKATEYVHDLRKAVFELDHETDDPFVDDEGNEVWIITKKKRGAKIKIRSKVYYKMHLTFDMDLVVRTYLHEVAHHFGLDENFSWKIAFALKESVTTPKNELVLSFLPGKYIGSGNPNCYARLDIAKNAKTVLIHTYQGETKDCQILPKDGDMGVVYYPQEDRVVSNRKHHRFEAWSGSNGTFSFEYIHNEGRKAELFKYLEN